MGAIAPERTFGAVPHVSAVPDIQETGHLKLLIAKRSANAARPPWVRIAHNPRIGVVERESVGVDIQRSAWRSAARRGIRHHRGIADAAADKTVSVDHAQLLPHDRNVTDRAGERAREQIIVDAGEILDDAAIPGPLEADIPTDRARGVRS